MKKTITLSLLFLLITTIHAHSQSLSGSYEIGTTNADYTTITNAVSALDSHGISGPVVFNIQNGSYNEQVEIKNIAGTSYTNTITFQSKSGDSSKVLIHFSGNSYNNYVFYINGGDNLIIKNLTFKAEHDLYGRIISFDRKSESIELMNNAFYGYYKPTQNIHDDYSSLIFCYGFDLTDTIQDIIIKNNLFRYGTNAIDLNFNTNIHCNNLLIEGNSVDSFYLSGIGTARVNNVTIRDNHVTNTDTSIESLYGISVGTAANGLNIEKNTIFINNKYCIGLGVSFTGSSSNRGRVVNNSITVIGFNNISQNSRGISSYNNKYTDFVFNTIKVVYGSNIYIPYSQALQFAGNMSTQNRFLNNIVITNTALISGFFEPTFFAQCNHNCYFTTSDTFTRYNSYKYYSYSSWKSVTQHDSHSVFINPTFHSIKSIKHYVYPLNIGVNYPNVSTDYFGSQRKHPTIGAYELKDADFDLAIRSIISPTNTFCPSSQTMRILVANEGQDTIKSDTLFWFVNGTQQQNTVINNPINPGDTAHIVLNNYQFNARPYDDLKVYHSLINDSILDLNKYNDTLVFDNFPKQLSGTYTIGGNQADFSSLTEACSYLAEKGMCDTVTFLIKAGTYYEEAEVSSVSGLSASTPLIIRGENKNTVFLNPSSNFILNISQASHILIENITFQGYNQANAWSILLQITNNSHHVIIRNNIFKGFSIAHSTVMVKVYQLYANSDHILIENNKFIDGTEHIHVYGNSYLGTSKYIKILNNYSEYAENNAIFLYLTDSCLIENNTIIGDSSFSTTGLKMVKCRQSIIQNNKIHNFTIAASINDENLNANDTSLFLNNFFYCNSGSQTSDIYGLFLGTSAKINFYHNTFKLVTTIADSSFLLIYGGWNNDIALVNNLLIAEDKAKLIKYENTNSNISFNHNDFYYGMDPKKFFINTTAYTFYQFFSYTNKGYSLLNYKLNKDPHFVSATNLHLDSNYKALSGVNLGVLYDIDGDARCGILATLGADESNYAYQKPSISIDCPDTFCRGNLAVISNNTIADGIIKYSWFYNNQLVSEAKNYTFTPMTIGIDTIKLIARNCQHADTFTKVFRIVSIAADFYTSNNFPVLKTDTVDLFNSSKCYTTGIKWDIQPTSFTAISGYPNSNNPKIVFNDTGCYHVQLIASQGAIKDTLYHACFINVQADTIAPVISMFGKDTIYLAQCDTAYTDLGASAYDMIDGNLTDSLTITSNFNSMIHGAYWVKYNVSDRFGNSAIQQQRTIIVSPDNIPPILYLKGNDSVTINLLDNYTDSGFIAFDSCIGLDTVLITGSVFSNRLETDTINFQAKDLLGNSTIFNTIQRLVYKHDPDPVYPGDANKDSIVNNLDILAVGIAFGSSGYTRPAASTNWSPQAAPFWLQNLANGSDYKHIGN